MMPEGETSPPLATEQVQRTSRALDQPEQIGAYRVIELINEGGMGAIYKAEQRHPVKRIVAIKLIKLGMDTKEVIARFESERQALAVMDHPNIATVLDAGATENGRPYFVMEYVPGEPITAYCDKHTLTTRQRLELFVQVCDAVQHAHQKGIIHRDIKPSNILVAVRDGRPIPKVIDFGVAKATSQKLTERTLFTETGQLIGTPEYMSPEQAEMSALDVDTRSDVYSLGVVLYQLLTGVLPFDPKTLRRAAFAEIQRIIREVDPPRPSTRLSSLDVAAAADLSKHHHEDMESLRDALKRELEWIPLKAMRKDRTQRYRSASELADDIHNYLTRRPLIAAPESASYKLRKFLTRHRGAVAAAVTVFVTLLLGIAATTVALIGQSHERAVAVSQRAIAQHEAENARHEAAKQQAVNAFLQEMLGAADPRKLTAADRAKGKDVTVLAALNEAARMVDSGSINEPEVEWSVRATIGDTYRAIGEYPKAQAQMSRALNLIRKLHPQPHPDVAKSLDLLATIQQETGALDDAERNFREALIMRRQTLGDKHLDVAESLNNLGLILQMQGKLADVEPLYRQAIVIFRKQERVDEARVATSLSNLALLLQTQGKLSEAEQTQRESLGLRRKTFGAEHPDLAMSLSNLGLVLQSQGKADQAEQLFSEALAMYRKLYGEQHPDVATAMNNLAGALKEQRRLADAEQLYREVIQIRRKMHGDSHPAIATSMNNLGMVLQEQGKLAEASKLHHEALEMRRKLLGDQHPDVAMSLNNLGLIATAEQNFQEAESLFREALAINQKLFGDEHVAVATNQSNLAGALRDQNRLAESEQLYRQALSTLRKKLGDQHPYIAVSMAKLAQVLLKESKTADAEPLAREALRICQSSLPPHDPRTAVAAQTLGAILSAEGKYAEAEPLLVGSFNELAHSQNSTAELRRRSITDLIELYQRWKRAEQAAQWQAELEKFDREAGRPNDVHLPATTRP